MAAGGFRRYIAAMQNPIDPRYPEMRRRRFRPIPVRMLVPNVITLLAICAGLTAIRLSTEGRMELAVAAIVFAAVLDGVDGRVARLMKGQSRFGAELDSLADFVNFGVAPGLILYFWQLHDLSNVGWIAAMTFAVSGGLRLARFNATMDDPNKPPFAANYFTGVPAPAGAITVLLPIYLGFLDLPRPPATLTAAYTLAIAVLMVSRLPVFSGKAMRWRVEPEMVLPVFVGVVFFIALLIGILDTPHGIEIAGGIICLLAYFYYVYRTIRSSGDVAESHEMDPLIMDRRADKEGGPPNTIMIIQLLLGLFAMVGGAHLFVHELLTVAESLGVAAIILSLILAPLATELPEKANSFFWVRDGKDALALGNITGAMVFQSTIPVAVGMIFIDWSLDRFAIISMVLGLAGGAVAYWSLRRAGQFNIPSIVIWGLLYLAFLAYVVFFG